MAVDTRARHPERAARKVAAKRERACRAHKMAPPGSGKMLRCCLAVRMRRNLITGVQLQGRRSLVDIGH